jgi:carbamoyl-phosphate synthase large subunit
MHQQQAGKLFVDDFFLVPTADAPTYVDTIREIYLSQGIDVLIPMTEPELSVLGSFMEELGADRCISAGSKTTHVGLDKLLTIQAMSSFGLPTPWTVSSEQLDFIRYPCIFKRRFGSGSRAVFRVEDRTDATYLSSKYPLSIFQELLEPEENELTCGVYRDRRGRVMSIQFLRRLVGGFTGWAKVVDHPEVTALCEILAEKLDLRGSMNVQLRLTDAGPRVFEINPRISSTVHMRHLLGFSDVVWAFDEIEGRDVTLPHVQQGVVVARTHNSIILD